VIFDEIASAYFCRRSLAGDLGARYGAQAGGKPEARIYATGQRVSAANAALANGAAGHGEEVDGAHVIGGHPGASIVHAAMAMAERQHACGADLVNAVVLGYDVGVRIIEACGGFYAFRSRFGLHSDFLHAFGCSAAASRLLGLDARQHSHAMALTSFSANAQCALFAEKRHISKSVCNGLFASAGVTGALMAAIGMEGNEDILGAPNGTLHSFGLEGHRDAVLRELGKEYAIMGANFKFINAEYPIHTPVEAALALVTQHGIKVDTIESVYVGLPTNSVKILDSRNAQSIGVQDMVSAALVQGGLKLHESPFPDILDNPSFRRLHPRVVLQGDAELDRDQPSGRGAIVVIKTQSGSSFSLRLDNPRGHSLRGGVTWSDLAVKWQESLPECDVARMLAKARQLEDLKEAGELLDSLGEGA
jgi:2-methylcitrate dehydratase PrpD